MKWVLFRNLLLLCSGEERRLCWYGFVIRMDKDSCIKKCRSLNVEGTCGRERPKRMWDKVGEEWSSDVESHKGDDKKKKNKIIDNLLCLRRHVQLRKNWRHNGISFMSLTLHTIYPWQTSPPQSIFLTPLGLNTPYIFLPSISHSFFTNLPVLNGSSNLLPTHPPSTCAHSLCSLHSISHTPFTI